MDETLYGGTPAGGIRKTFSRSLDGLNGSTRERFWQTFPSFSECQAIKRVPQHPKPNPNHMSNIIQHILELFDLISSSPAPLIDGFYQQPFHCCCLRSDVISRLYYLQEQQPLIGTCLLDAAVDGVRNSETEDLKQTGSCLGEEREFKQQTENYNSIKYMD